MNDKTQFSIKEAAAEYQLSEVYLRRMILQGKIPSKKVPVGDTEILRHVIQKVDLEAWRQNSSVRTVRQDGRGKNLLYATAPELEAIQKFLVSSKNGAVIEKANKPEDVKRRYAAAKVRRLQKKAEAKAKVPAAVTPSPAK